MNRVKRVVGEVMNQLRGALLVSASDGGLVEGLNGVLDALRLLTLGVNCIQGALRYVG